ncbi:hypothetical protein FACS189473_3390 [Spirochaetia bacterium]|nr:hypothetical protein FACS189473_3390 [Spirochaetia bacterium]
MAKGAAFLSEEEQTPRGSARHLNIIITNPTEDMDPVVVQEMQRGAEESRWLPAELTPFFKYFL